MFARFKELVSNFFNTTEVREISILGQKFAGKTTLVKQIELQEELPIDRVETHGQITREHEVLIDGRVQKFKTIDVGGSDIYSNSQMWSNAIARSWGLIYVINSETPYLCNGIKNSIMEEYMNDLSHCPNKNTVDNIEICGCASNDAFRQARLKKAKTVSIIDSGLPLLFWLNKQDLDEALPPEELIKIYNLEQSEKYNYRIENGSALLGTNVFSALSWLLSEVYK